LAQPLPLANSGYWLSFYNILSIKEAFPMGYRD